MSSTAVVSDVVINDGWHKKKANPNALLGLVGKLLGVIEDKLGSEVDYAASDFKAELEGLKAEGGCEQLVGDEELLESYKEIVQGNNLTRQRVKKVIEGLKAALGGEVLM